MRNNVRKKEGILKSFASRNLNQQQKNYSTKELEMLAVVSATDRFKHYLLRMEFIVASVYQTLQWALIAYRDNNTYYKIDWIDGQETLPLSIQNCTYARQRYGDCKLVIKRPFGRTKGEISTRQESCDSNINWKISRSTELQTQSVCWNDRAQPERKRICAFAFKIAS